MKIRCNIEIVLKWQLEFQAVLVSYPTHSPQFSNSEMLGLMVVWLERWSWIIVISLWTSLWNYWKYQLAFKNTRYRYAYHMYGSVRFRNNICEDFLCFVLTHCGLTMSYDNMGVGSALAKVMAWCQTAPSYYLNQCSLTINKVIGNSSYEVPKIPTSKTKHSI